MPKISKNLGKTVPCPVCKEPIIYQADYTGIGHEIDTCPHCGAKFKREVKQKMIITLTKLTILIIVVGLVYSIFSFLLIENQQQATINIKPHE